MPAAFSAGVTYADDPVYTAAGQYLVNSESGASDFANVPEFSPGVAGGGIKQFNFRSNQIMLQVMYVAGSDSEVKGLFDADMTSIGSALKATLNVYGIAYFGVTLNSNACKMGPVKLNGDGSDLCYAFANVAVIAYRNSGG